MNIFKHFRIGGLHIYISTYSLKRRRSIDSIYRHARPELQREKHRRCSADTGYCEMCGRKFYPRELEMHHIIPVSERPDLVTSPRNLQMLCHGCHTKVHKQPPGTKLG